jgi:hypothetical protein
MSDEQVGDEAAQTDPSVTIRTSVESRNRIRKIKNLMALHESREVTMEEALREALDAWESVHLSKD